MKCQINGHEYDLADGATVSQAVAVLAPVLLTGIAVAVDGDVVPRSQWNTTALTSGARVEVLTAVQGG